ncbi:MAG: imidazoleglycerol-phosphate dehydratase HisB [Candidatus Omnitrophota bacterium]
MKKRKALIKRKTKETDIKVDLNIDGKGKSKIITGIPFLDHMLTLFSKHGLMDLKIAAKGDLEVDLHHTNEDIGITLGKAFKEALCDKKKINRYGDSFVPMDGSLVRVVVDISNRPSLHIHQKTGKNIQRFLDTSKIGKGEGYSFVACEQFITAFVINAGINMHIEILSFDRDLHHLIEAIFKAMARAIDSAVKINKRVMGIPSTKGKL